MADRIGSKKVIESVKDMKIEFIYMQFVDLLGTLKAVQIPALELSGALDSGVGFDGSSVEGFARICESDMVLKPDPSTFSIIPWGSQPSARMICDVTLAGGKPFEGDPRLILKRAAAEAEKMGFVYNVGPELEFFLFKGKDGPVTEPVLHDVASYFDFSPLDVASDVRCEAVLALQKLGLTIEASHHEVAPAQHEIDFRFGDALSTADKVITYKAAIKAIAAKFNLFASFMPKPIFGVNGSGMHVHQNLMDVKTKKNAFFEPKDKYALSKTAYYFIGGQLAHMKDIIAVLAPTVNSYKRLTPGYEAPVYICWGRKNRSALIRIPEYFPGKQQAARAELRCPDPSCNPYLAFAVMLKAGLDGIKNKIEPAGPVEEDVYDFDDAKLKKLYIESLPGSLGEAIAHLEKSELVRKTLGEHAFAKFIEAKKREWDEYRIQVTKWEIDKYLQVL